jgi:aminoglycoside phosphotransferase (APT) family kinase protein
MAEGIGLEKLAGVPAANELITRWQQASGFSLEQLDYYTGLSLLQFGIIMHRVGTLYTQAGHIPPEMEYDRNNCVTSQLDAYLAKWSIPTA